MSNTELIEQEEYIGTVQAARLAGSTPQTIRRWASEGKIRVARPGRKLLVSAKSLAEALTPVARREVE